MQQYVKKEIDYLKAFAILLVVFYHAIYEAKLFLGNMTFICLNIGLEHVHVPLFILIAGFLCHKQDLRSFYIKKIKRILIPFIFMSCLKLLYNNLISAEHIHEGNIWNQIFDAFVCGGTYWFCYCLLVIFALAPLFWDNRKRIWALLAVLSAANIVLRWTDVSLTNVLQINQVVNQMPFFLMGMLIRSYDLTGLVKKKKYCQYIILAASICLAVVCGYVRFYLDFYLLWLTDVFFGLSVMYMLYFIAVRIKGRFAGAVLGTMGKYSLQIMFLDSFFRITFYYLVYMFAERGIAAALTVTVLDITVSCLVCIAARKIPVLSKLMGL